MLRNPEFRRALCRSVPLCLAFSLLAFFLHPLAGAVCVLLSAALLTLYTLDMRRRYRMISRLSEDIDAVLHGTRAVRFADYSEGELSLLRNELQKMTARLSEQAALLLREKNRLAEALADISHQLRTPLTAAHLLLASLSEDGAAPPEELRALRAQLERMDRLVEALLKLARLDAGTVRFRPEPVELSALIARAAEPLAIAMELKGQRLRVHATGRAVCDPVWTAEALGNILKNCMEHTGQGEISVFAEETAIAATLRIRDSGGGIDPADLPHLFERYYRGANAAENGVGIGLALSRSILAAQNGTVSVANVPTGAENPPTGAEFTIRLYKGVV